MSNIAISELDSEATVLNDNDLLLVSKQSTDGTMYTSMKMKGSVLKSGAGTCNFSSSVVKQACSEAIQQSVIGGGLVIDPDKTDGFRSGYIVGNLDLITLSYDSVLYIRNYNNSASEPVVQLIVKNSDGINVMNMTIDYSLTYTVLYFKKNSNIYITSRAGSTTAVGNYIICPLTSTN